MTLIPKEPLLTDAIKTCAVCGIDTYWRVKGQSTKGTCPDHSPAWRSPLLASHAELIEIRGQLRQAFGQVDVLTEPRHPAYPPGGFDPPYERVVRYRFQVNPDRFGRSHGPDKFVTTHRFVAPHPDAGPCVGCTATVRRYGDLARLHCTTCRKES
jgi:hypothetical protein